MSNAATDIERLARALATIDADGECWSVEAAKMLVDAGPGPKSVLAYMANLPQLDRQACFDGSHETSSHHKWLVTRSPQPRFTIWLHEYRSQVERDGRYAEVPHDHRYDLASVILAGGYSAQTFVIDTEGVPRLTGERRYDAGDVMHVAHDTVHRLSTIDDSTLTLVAEGPPKKHASTAYIGQPPVPTRFVDFAGQWKRLESKLNRDARTSL